MKTVFNKTDDVALARDGLEHLRLARECFVAAGAKRTADRCRLAISSAKGAVRNAQHRPYRKVEAANG